MRLSLTYLKFLSYKKKSNKKGLCARWESLRVDERLSASLTSKCLSKEEMAFIESKRHAEPDNDASHVIAAQKMSEIMYW